MQLMFSWDVTAQLNDAVLGISPAAFASSMDLATSFDRLVSETLNDICDAMDPLVCKHVLPIYIGLQRFL